MIDNKSNREHNRKIGFFDSGIGGLSVLYEAIKILPKEDYIYYADTVNQPYGIKTKQEVRRLVFEAIDFIVNKNVKAIVVACNTATSVAIRELREEYDIPIIGMEPAVKPAIESTKKVGKKVLVTATKLTLKEDKLQNLITALDSESIVDLLELQELVQFAENLDFNEDRVSKYLIKQFNDFDLNSYQTIVLGCTHFTFFKDIIRKLIPSDMTIIDGNIGTVKHLQSILLKNNESQLGNGKIDFYNSGILSTGNKELHIYECLFNKLKSINF